MQKRRSRAATSATGGHLSCPSGLQVWATAATGADPARVARPRAKWEVLTCIQKIQEAPWGLGDGSVVSRPLRHAVSTDSVETRAHTHTTLFIHHLLIAVLRGHRTLTAQLQRRIFAAQHHNSSLISRAHILGIVFFPAS
eukprot:51497-Chlamydomonas_euryale.AAC.6